MKVCELFEDDNMDQWGFPVRSAPIPWSERPLRKKLQDKSGSPFSRAVQAARKDTNHRFVGAGATAYVSRQEDPHNLDTVTRTSEEDEITSVYLEMILKSPSAANNPYFPRVKAVKRSDGVTQVVMERLLSIMAPAIATNYHLIKSLWERMLHIPFVPAEEGYAKAGVQRTTMMHLADHIEGACGNPAKRNVIRDPALLHACEQIGRLAVEEEGQLDIHYNNIMWRLTNNMPHLVIVDPIYRHEYEELQPSPSSGQTRRADATTE